MASGDAGACTVGQEGGDCGLVPLVVGAGGRECAGCSAYLRRGTPAWPGAAGAPQDSPSAIFRAARWRAVHDADAAIRGDGWASDIRTEPACVAASSVRALEQWWWDYNL